MDPLSDLLSLLRLRTYMSGGFQAGGDWSLAFGPHDGIKFYAVVSGECWLAVDGLPAPLRARAGDCLLLPRGRPFRVASNLDLPSEVLSGPAFPTDGGVYAYNGGTGFFCVGGYFTLAGDGASMLLDVLPPVVHIHREADRAVLRWCLERLRHEVGDPQPGSVLAARQLASLMLVQVLRLHLADKATTGVGWLFALSDRHIGAALRALHAHPDRRWTLQSLAETVGLSRTVLALRFRNSVGDSVMGYLTRWRMLLAAERLARSTDSVAAIAFSLGYESESAFSTAFKRIHGASPRQYGRDRRAEHDPQQRLAA